MDDEIRCPGCRRPTVRLEVFGFCEHCGHSAVRDGSPAYVGAGGPAARPFGLRAARDTRHKQRHWLVTGWLILMFVANALTALLIPLSAPVIRQSNPSFPDWAVWVFPVLALLNVACTVALWYWQKWGFWGFCASAALGLVANLAAGQHPVVAAIGAVVGIAILYGVLQLGWPRSAWSQLE